MGAKKHDRERSVWITALMAAGALVLGWATVELAFKPLLQAGRASIRRSLNPDYDPDDDIEIPAPRDEEKDELPEKSEQEKADAKAKALPRTPQDS